jgi:hypothetical protein
MANLKDALLKNVGYEKGQFDIKKQMAKKTFGGDDFLSSVLREKLGLEKEKKGKSPSKEGSEGLGAEASSVLTIIAKNTMVLPGMAKDVKNLSQNIQKLVKLKGGKSTSSASDFFRKQKDKVAGKLKPGKSKSPTASVGKKVASAAPSGIMDILVNIGGFISGALIQVVKSLFNPMTIIRLLGRLALPLLIVGTLVSGIMAGWKKYQETGSFTESIVSYFGGMLEFLTLGLFGEDQLKGVLSSLGEIFKPVTDSVSKIFDSVKGFFKNIFGDLIKEDVKPPAAPAAPQTSMDDSDDANAKSFVPPTSSTDVSNKTTEEVIPKGIFGDLEGVAKAGEGGDFGAMIAAGEEFKKKYPVKAPAPPSPVVAPPAVAASPSPIVPPAPAAGGSGTATPDSDDSEVKKLAEYFGRPENAADNAQLEELQNRIGTIKRGIRDTKSLIASSTTNEEKERHEKILKEQLEPGLEATKKLKKAILDKARNALQIKTTGESGATPAPPPPPTAPTAAAGGDKYADKAESNFVGALQFMKRSLGIMPPDLRKPGSPFTDMKNGDKELSEEEVRKRISAAGKNPDKVLELLKDTGKGGGSIDLRSGNLNTITGGAIGGGAGSAGGGGGGGGGGGSAPSVTPSGGGAPSGESISSSSSQVSEGQRMESAADKGSTVNAGTTNNSSGTTGKPSKQTASAYDDGFAQRLAAS